MKIANFSFLVLWGATLICAEEIPINPNVGHLNHLHTYHPAHPTAPPTEDRFSTSRNSKITLPLPIKSEEENFTFAILGDRTSGPADGVAILANAVRDINLLNPDLVMSIGDLVQGYNTPEEWIPQAKEYLDIVSHFNPPFFPVSGNHDVYWRGPEASKPASGGNAPLFEEYFGPLWYAFEHKGSWFIVLYTDEGNPKTGEQNFSKPESQVMSDAQFQWLDATLKKAENAKHVFVFMHQPRWVYESYGDDWKKVHARLVEAKNVRAVFAGHVHRMEHNGIRDGIEYMTLATTGGSLNPANPEAGYKHHFDLVSVRGDQISITAIPVGQIMDVREMTPAHRERMFQIKNLPIDYPKLFDLSQQSGDQSAVVAFTNPVDTPIKVHVKLKAHDPRWKFHTPEWTLNLAPQETVSQSMRLSHPLKEPDDLFDFPTLEIQSSYQAKGARYTAEIQKASLPVKFPIKLSTEVPNQALKLNGLAQWIPIPSNKIQTGKHITVECRFKAAEFGKRTGLISKAQSSDYGLFIDKGIPKFIIHVGGSYLSASAQKPLLKANAWHHLAAVYDGEEARLYLDGQLVARAPRSGELKHNSLPLIIGGDVDNNPEAVDLFTGEIDFVRVSSKALYQGEQLDPQSIHQSPSADDHTALLLNFNQETSSWYLDESPRATHVKPMGRPSLVPVIQEP